MKQILEIIGEVMVETIQDSMLNFGLEDSNIIKNVTYRIEGTSVVLQIPDYWKYIEKGRRPNLKQPPVSVILKWIERKGIQGRGRISKNELAWAISKSIAKKGIKPRPFLSVALKRLETEVLDGVALDFSDFLDSEIKRILG